MPVIISTTNPGDVIDVTGNSGTLNGSPQGAPIIEIAILGPSAEVTISNSSIGQLVQLTGVGMEVTATNSTIMSISGGNGGATYTFDNVTVTHGTNLGGVATTHWNGQVVRLAAVSLRETGMTR